MRRSQSGVGPRCPRVVLFSRRIRNEGQDPSQSRSQAAAISHSRRQHGRLADCDENHKCHRNKSGLLAVPWRPPYSRGQAFGGMEFAIPCPVWCSPPRCDGRFAIAGSMKQRRIIGAILAVAALAVGLASVFVPRAGAPQSARLERIIADLSWNGAALQQLRELGPEGRPAVPYLTALLEDPERSGTNIYRTLAAIGYPSDSLVALVAGRLDGLSASGAWLSDLEWLAEQGLRAAAAAPAVEACMDGDARVGRYLPAPCWRSAALARRSATTYGAAWPATNTSRACWSSCGRSCPRRKAPACWPRRCSPAARTA